MQANSSVPPQSIDAGAAALWASAFVLAGMILVSAGRHAENPAYAGQVAEVAGLRILTADAGSNEEVVALLNQNDETLSVYGIENQRSLELYEVVRLPELFDQSGGPQRGGTGGRR